MSLFQHPHLTRGTVHTPLGSFAVNRGVVDLPEDIGRTLGWTPLDAEVDLMATGGAETASRGSAPDAGGPQHAR
jgi:hypothetical protein